MDFQEKRGMGYCGLACVLCSHEGCPGCAANRNDREDDCFIRKCAAEKGMDGCYACPDYPCREDVPLLQEKRNKAFNRYAREFGKHALIDRLRVNYENGITYHRPDKLPGDYDRCKTEQEVMELLKYGKPDPYMKCPEYESESFYLRLVSMDDAKDLLACYKNPTISVRANGEGCDYGYGSQTPEEMREFIRRWLEEYKNRRFVRLSIVGKRENKAVGTIEIFDSHESHIIARRVDVMLDVRSQYETEERLSELFKISDSFFHDFKCDKIVTQIMPEAICRKNAAAENGYAPYPVSDAWEWENCYIKRKP